MKRLAVIGFGLALLGQVGCSSFAELTAPPSFARLEGDDSYDYRATNANGVVLAVRSEPNEPKGDLKFWSETLRLRLESEGYRSMGSTEARLEKGEARGVRWKFESTHNGRLHDYWVTVYVIGDRVVVLEAAGDRAFFTESTERELESAMATLRTNAS